MSKNNNIFVSAAVLAMCLFGVLPLCGCLIFDPRPAETPVIQTGVTDPFNFAQLLSGTGERFGKLALEDLFNPAFTYETVEGIEYVRDRQLERLKAIADTSGAYDTIMVSWKRDSSHTESEAFSRSSGAVIYRVYSVVAKPRNAENISFSGTSRFTLVFLESKNTWTILRWADGGSPSIFNPLYNDQ